MGVAIFYVLAWLWVPFICVAGGIGSVIAMIVSRHRVRHLLAFGLSLLSLAFLDAPTALMLAGSVLWLSLSYGNGAHYDGYAIVGSIAGVIVCGFMILGSTSGWYGVPILPTLIFFLTLVSSFTLTSVVVAWISNRVRGVPPELTR